MPTYKRRVLSVRAVQWTGDNFDEVCALSDAGLPFKVGHGGGPKTLYIHTPNGGVVAEPGDWVCLDVSGNPYPCTDEVFRKSYVVDSESVEDTYEESPKARLLREAYEIGGFDLAYGTGRALGLKESYCNACEAETFDFEGVCCVCFSAFQPQGAGAMRRFSFEIRRWVRMAEYAHARVEVTSPAEAHEKVRKLYSEGGLNWTTDADTFEVPFGPDYEVIKEEA